MSRPVSPFEHHNATSAVVKPAGHPRRPLWVAQPLRVQPQRHPAPSRNALALPSSPTWVDESKSVLQHLLVMFMGQQQQQQQQQQAATSVRRQAAAAPDEVLPSM